MADEPVLRVQTLVETGLSNVPSSYIQPPINRPNSSPNPPNSTNVPIIDLSNFDPNHLKHACIHWGAFQITNHGFPIRLLDEMRNLGMSFFEECTMEEKLKYGCDGKVAASEGYGSRMLVRDDSVLDWRDYFDHHTLPVSRRNPSKWPEFSTNYRGVVVEYSDQMNVLAMKLLGMISESLGLPTSSVEDAVGEVYQNITISYYPTCPQPKLTLGLQAHSDFGAITLLIQDDVGGLQVLKDGEWLTAHPVSDAIVVILADQVEIITNGQYKSAEHRAITNAHRARLSVATFHDPAKSKKIFPTEKLINKKNPARYKEVTYGDYVSAWYTKGPEGKRNVDALLLQQQDP
ncbi:hypothetical protein GIB67_035312 [Kingdonia uniflora]|uniref:Fe2OG dioxygenase domain-containing protein n=1 Tax=Kingdonia uniflora TaxID=39325 RepID=A0A7J7KY01_9MAGN|nr:hypothetical protein GIB67_035312 [Kingdonia uniflora]